MSNFYNTVLRNSKAFRSDDRTADINLLEPGTRKAVLDMVAEAHEMGHDLRILETYRSQTRQSYLFMKRVTKLRTVGCHGYGVAADFGVFVGGRYMEDNKPYEFLVDLAKKHGLISGQNWGHFLPNGKPKPNSFVDSGHVQRIPVQRQNEMFNGQWYPDENYDPFADMKAHGWT